MRAWILLIPWNTGERHKWTSWPVILAEPKFKWICNFFLQFRAHSSNSEKKKKCSCAWDFQVPFACAPFVLLQKLSILGRCKPFLSSIFLSLVGLSILHILFVLPIVSLYQQNFLAASWTAFMYVYFSFFKAQLGSVIQAYSPWMLYEP